tara:strand:+ start:316 stop:627 length:312 start_codon:yes stop_codon:yes gene_type:complete
MVPLHFGIKQKRYPCIDKSKTYQVVVGQFYPWRKKYEKLFINKIEEHGQIKIILIGKYKHNLDVSVNIMNKLLKYQEKYMIMSYTCKKVYCDPKLKKVMKEIK